ncbi:MAG: 23S rRNA (guanosine(2251)-2'-O)-methyltransferase RlmB [Kiritimatiellia bacterium]
MRDTIRSSEWLYGRRPVIEVLRAGRRKIHEVVLQQSKERSEELDAIERDARALGIQPHRMKRDELDRLTKDGHHQGAAIRVGAYPYADLEDVLEALEEEGSGLVLVLDHLEDPQNVGSLMRTAEAAGAKGVLLAEDRACGVTPAAVRASAGASEHLNVVRVVNIVQAMERLKKANVWLTGLDMDTQAKPYTEVDFRGKCGIVVGSEGSGISRLARERCDFMAYLPMHGAVESLNAGVAGGIVLFEALRQQGGK